MGSLRLQHIFCDGMVIQRNTQVNIGGWANPKALIKVSLANKEYLTQSNHAGEWQIAIKTGDAGGPYQLQVTDNKDNKLVIEDILLGDVWLCAGQSNMEMSMQAMKNDFPEEYTDCTYPLIRQFRVPVSFQFDGQKTDYEGGEWTKLSPQTVSEFSAVGCTFAKEIYKRHNVPLGIILAALGGSNAESWMSREALVPFPHFLDELQCLAQPGYTEKVMSQELEDKRQWRESVDLLDKGLSAEVPFFAVNCDLKKWREIILPGYWKQQGFGDFNGVVWFRKTVTLSQNFFMSDEIELHLGVIAEEDVTYVNGIEVGSMPTVYNQREYKVPKGLLHLGENVIVVRVLSYAGRGGFVPEKRYSLVCGARELSLAGNWKCQIGGKMPPLAEGKNLQWKGPSGLYNAMIAPLHRYCIKGTLWYQGESNTKWPLEYGQLMRALIADWREKWNMPDMPFYYVQLPNFMEPSPLPQESEWARLREQQRLLQEVPQTGMAVTIDIGEWNDIHPKNKRDVGCRLARLARKHFYGETELVDTGPVLTKVEFLSEAIILYFSHSAGGLQTIGGKSLENFAVQNEDGQYRWAKAKIVGDTVQLYDINTQNIKRIRYAWADTPAGGLLYNREGLPASPFMWEQKQKI